MWWKSSMQLCILSWKNTYAHFFQTALFERGGLLVCWRLDYYFGEFLCMHLAVLQCWQQWSNAIAEYRHSPILMNCQSSSFSLHCIYSKDQKKCYSCINMDQLESFNCCRTMDIISCRQMTQKGLLKICSVQWQEQVLPSCLYV